METILNDCIFQKLCLEFGIKPLLPLGMFTMPRNSEIKKNIPIYSRTSVDMFQRLFQMGSD